MVTRRLTHAQPLLQETAHELADPAVTHDDDALGVIVRRQLGDERVGRLAGELPQARLERRADAGQRRNLLIERNQIIQRKRRAGHRKFKKHRTKG